ncbi:MAG: outer membrane beta-barrel family protein, partial [Chitinophagales bacterium]
HKINNALSNNLDIQINDKNALTFNTTFNTGISNDEGDVETEFLDSASILYNYYKRNYNDHQNDYNTDNTLTYTKTFDKKGQNLIVTGNYSFFKQQENPEYYQPSYFLDQSINETILATQEHNVSKDINHTTYGQIDYAQPFEKANGLLEVGAKSAYRNILNDFTSDSLNRTTLSFEQNNGLSNQFRYKEIINASYVIYGGSYKNFSYKGGVRMEHSIIKGNQSVGNVNFTNKYISFFPSAYLAQKFEKGHEISLQYRRSINRPRSRMLNPFGEYSDPYNIRVGNPNLKPVFTESLEFSYVKNFKNVFLTSSVFFKYSKNPYTRYRTLDSNGVATLDFGNLDNSKDVGLELILRTQITKWWNIMTNANLFGNIISGSVPSTGEVSNQNINSFQWNIRMISNMTVWKKTASIQVMWFYRGKRKFLQGELKPFTFVNIGFKKDFLKDNKATIALNISDIFNTMKFRVSSVSDNYSGFVKEIGKV